jgi:hypothetical protein
MEPWGSVPNFPAAFRMDRFRSRRKGCRGWKAGALPCPLPGGRRSSGLHSRAPRKLVRPTEETRSHRPDVAQKLGIRHSIYGVEFEFYRVFRAPEAAMPRSVDDLDICDFVQLEPAPIRQVAVGGIAIELPYDSVPAGAPGAEDVRAKNTGQPPDHRTHLFPVFDRVTLRADLSFLNFVHAKLPTNRYNLPDPTQHNDTDTTLGRILALVNFESEFMHRSALAANRPGSRFEMGGNMPDANPLGLGASPGPLLAGPRGPILLPGNHHRLPNRENPA